MNDNKTAQLALVKIGAWYSECCAYDTYRIDTETEAEYVREHLRDGDYGMQVWATEREAFEYWLSVDKNEPDMRAFIEQRLKCLT